MEATQMMSNVYYGPEETYILAYEEEGEEKRERYHFTDERQFYDALSNYEQDYTFVEFMTETYCMAFGIGYPEGEIE